MVHRGPCARPDRHVAGLDRRRRPARTAAGRPPRRTPSASGSIRPSRLAISMRAAPSSARLALTGPAEKKMQSPGWRADMPGQAVALGVGQVLGHRTAQRAVLADQHIGQSAVPALFGPLLPAVQRATRLRRPAGHHHRTNIRRLEDAKCGVFEELCAFHQLQPEPHIGLVGAEPAHRLAVADPRDRGGHLVADQRPQRGENLLRDRDDVLGVDEAHLHVELGEFGLTVGAEVLVAVAAGDLVVPLHPGHHQQLLEQLRALRQGVERTRVQPRRHQEVARPFRCRAGDRRRLDLDEVVPRQHRAGGGIHLGAQPDCRSRAVAAQVEVAVFQPQLLARRLVELERQRRALAEDGQRRGVDLDVAGGDLGVGVAFRADLDDAGDRDAELSAQPVRLRQYASALAEHHLRNT